MRFRKRHARSISPNPYAELPVIKKTGEIELIPWGRRKEQKGKLPATRWACHESIQEHKWDSWQPVPVKILVDRFMEKDDVKQPHWFDLNQRDFIQGLLASWQEEQRLYVVTVAPPYDRPGFHRWPRIVSA
jgi:hypothetical protein